MNAPNRELREVIREEPVMRARILELLAVGAADRPRDRRPRWTARPTRSSSGSWACAATAGSGRSRASTDEGYFRYEAIAKDPS